MIQLWLRRKGFSIKPRSVSFLQLLAVEAVAASGSIAKRDA